MDDSLSGLLDNTLLEKMPNTYVFTKKLSETLVQQAANTLPVTIVRPSIILSSEKDPFPVSNKQLICIYLFGSVHYLIGSYTQ